MKNNLFSVLKILSSDYADYGGNIKRWADPNQNYPDCSCGCKYFVSLKEPFNNDWGVCANKNSPRAGLLTWEHQAGYNCFEMENNNESNI